MSLFLLVIKTLETVVMLQERLWHTQQTKYSHLGLVVLGNQNKFDQKIGNRLLIVNSLSSDSFNKIK